MPAPPDPVVTDHAEPTAELLTAIGQRAVTDDAQFRVVVVNPASVGSARRSGHGLQSQKRPLQ